jgi:anaerobic selenocysteine-containing dehydrogenase
MISAAYGHAPGFVIAAPEHFKRAALTGRPYPVRAAYVQVSNPVLAWSHPASTVQALKALDFLVVTETFPSPTSAWADLVLPAATHLEYNDLGHYGLAHGFVLARPRAVDPPGQCRPNPRILNDLAHALGLGQYWWDDWEGMLEDILAPSGWSYQRLAEEKILRGTPRYQKYKDKGFKTPTGKVELRLSRADKHDLPPLPAWDGPPETTDPDFPLTLTGHKSRNFFCSDHRYLKTLRSREPEPTAGIHPDDAAAAGVRPGEEVMVESRHGRVVVTADVTDDVAPGVVSLTVGWWRPEIGPQNPESYQSITYNTLTAPDQFARPLGTPNLRGLAVRIRPAG